ncbi:MAG: hypothetical protein E7237_07395 [Sarcina sp.]|nr:hypothetical protein [Sarcina sp.]
MMTEKERQIFEQELSREELEAISGGFHQRKTDKPDADTDDCTSLLNRDIYEDGFPNCTATVEDGSWCARGDACYGNAIGYLNMKDCHKAWR